MVLGQLGETAPTTITVVDEDREEKGPIDLDPNWEEMIALKGKMSVMILVHWKNCCCVV